MGGGSAEAPVDIKHKTSSEDVSNQMALLLEGINSLTQGMYAMNTAMLNQPEVPQAPAVKSTAPVDWKAKMDEVKAKATGDQSIQNRKDHGRSDTIHASLLLDDEDTTVSNLLGDTQPVQAQNFLKD